MRILVISQFYPPEPGAASVRIGDLTSQWAKNGNEVCVVTNFPNYLGAATSNPRKARLWKKEKVDNLLIIRTPTISRPRSNVAGMIINQMLFCLGAIIGGFLAPKCDVIVVSSPPFGLGIVGYIVSKIKRAPFVFEIRDLWPQSAVEIGIIKNRSLIGILKWIEEFTYRKAEGIICVTEGIFKELISRGFSKKAFHIPNGVNLCLFNPEICNGNIREQIGAKGKFVVGYAGLLGRIHGASIIMEIADILRHKEDIRFLIVGDGPDKEKMLGIKAQRDLKNVFFMKIQHPDRVPDIVASFDLGIATIRDVPLTKGSIPVKVFEYMAMACPVLLAGKGEAAGLLEKAMAGFAIDPAHTEELAGRIEELCNNRNLCQQLGENGYGYVQKHYSREENARTYLHRLKEIAG